MSNRTVPPISPPPPSQASDGRARAGKIIVLSAARPANPSAPPAPSARDESKTAPERVAAQDVDVHQTSTSGRPLEVHSDVHQTSTAPSSLIPPFNMNSVEPALADPRPVGRQMDVQMAQAQTAITAERIARSTKQPSTIKAKKKKKAGIDERGRFRHTIRLEPKSERKLREVAEILGVDLNAAIAVCISVHHHRLTRGRGDE